MAISEGFKDYVLDQLEYLGDVSVKKMFGGASLYYEGLIFAIIDDEDVLYFKVDDTNRTDYEKADMKPFKPFDDKPMVMPYYEVPAEVLESKEALAVWAEKSALVSRNAPKKKRKRDYTFKED